MEKGGTATKKEIVDDTGFTPGQVSMAERRLVDRGLFTKVTLKVKKRQPFRGFRMTVIDTPRVKVRIKKLLNKFEELQYDQ